MPKRSVVESKRLKHVVHVRPGTYFVCFHNGEAQSLWKWHFVEGKNIEIEIEPHVTVVIEPL
jgi:hypothetical protein